jgi:hypothetical protein
MKIGFVVSFFDFRNDVRRVITEVAIQHEVVIFGNVQQSEAIQRYLPKGIEFRLIEERKKSVWNFFWERIFLIFRAIPRSRNNFFLMELFKASIPTNPVQRKRNHQLLSWVRRLPKFISYDTYLDFLQIRRQTTIGDIDQYIFFTAIADDYLLARLIREKHPQLKVYVYSWDHPCKHTCFSKRLHFNCWSDGIKEDIVSLQRIPPTQVTVLGASQFGYVFDYLYKKQSATPAVPFRYIYFGCAIGISELVPHELQMVRVLATNLQEVQPSWKVLLRPYPVLKNWNYYDELRLIPNIVFDDQFRTEDTSVQDDAILKKYALIEQAEAFFHVGTTMGLEACFTTTPSFILDFGHPKAEGLSVFNFIHQYQNEKHLIHLSPQNAVTSVEALRKILQNPAKSEYQSLNHQVQQQYVLKPFATFAKDLIAQR